jgi:peroxiredoxin
MDTLIENGKQAPAIALPDLNGNLYTLADDVGKIVILNFWSAECPWSERVDQAVQPLTANWGDQVVYLPIASNANETPEHIQTTANQRNLPVILLDAAQDTANTYGAQTTPHCFVLDREGVLRYQGAFDNVTFRQRTPSMHYVRDAVEALLQGNLPKPEYTPPYGCTIVRFNQSA